MMQRLQSAYEAITTFGKAGYYLFKSADIMLKMNKYLVMGLTIYAALRLFKTFIYNPVA